MPRLALLRHGHTAWNRAGRLQGRTDIPLDDEASAGLRGLCLPPPWDTAHLVASPLARAMDTARLVAGRPATPVTALTEMNWGDWEGQRGADLRADPASGYRDMEDWGLAFRPPGGEAISELMARCTGWAASLTEDTVAVCHIGVMRVLLAQATGWQFEGPAPFRIKRNRLFIIDAQGRLDPDPLRLEARAP
jgi:probable phosphoglycerate mutase